MNHLPSIFICFCASLVLETLSTLYTRAVASGQTKAVILLSAAHEVLSWGLVYIVVSDLQLAIPSIIGNIFGTTIAMRIAKG